MAEKSPPDTKPEDAVTAASAEAPPAPRSLGAGPLLLLGLLWLAATMWSAHVAIAGNVAAGAVVIGSAALALPGVIAAGLLAGATAGLAGTSMLPRVLPDRIRRRVEPSLRRSRSHHRAMLGSAAGALVGMAAAAVIVAGYGARPSILLLAGTVGLAGVLGGLAAAASRPVLAAGITATLAVFLLGALVNYFQSPLKVLLGAGATVESRASAATALSILTAAAGGLAAGVVAFGCLRRYAGLASWPAFLAAGAMPGLLFLLAESLANVGGARLLALAGELSATDRTALDYLDGARINHALVVGFVGGILAMVLLGRTARRTTEGSAD